MKNKISARNIGLLFRYEWMSQKKSFLLMLGVLQGILALLIMLYFYKTDLSNSDYITNNMGIIALIIGVIFMISTVCVFIWQTKMLNHNFNQGNSSVPFMMLPASTTEKVIHTHLSYLFSFLAVCVAFIINIIFYLGLLILIIPDSNHLISEIMRMIDSIAIETHINYADLTLSFISLPISMLMGYSLYLNANMFFKKNAQAKSIILLIALSMIYKSYLGISWLAKIGNIYGVDNYMNNKNLSYTLLEVIPIIALFYLFHCQIKEKEIR